MMSAEEFGKRCECWLLAALGFALLAACAAAPPAGAGSAGMPPATGRVATGSTAPGPGVPGAAIPSGFHPTAALPHTRAPVRPLAAPAKPPSLVIPAAASLPGEALPLLGMDVPQVVRILGRPSQLRREAPAEVWQYANQRCLLYVFFYQRRGAQDWRVQYVEGRDRNTVALIRAEACLKEQLAPGRSSGAAW